LPDTHKISEFKGNQMFEVLTGINKQTGEEYWFKFGLKKAQAILENIDALRRFVDRQEFPHGHNDQK